MLHLYKRLRPNQSTSNTVKFKRFQEAMRYIPDFKIEHWGILVTLRTDSSAQVKLTELQWITMGSVRILLHDPAACKQS